MDANESNELKEARDFAALSARLQALRGEPPPSDEAIGAEALQSAVAELAGQHERFKQALAGYLDATAKAGLKPDPTITALADLGNARLLTQALFEFLTNPLHAQAIEGAIRMVVRDPQFLANYSEEDLLDLISGAATRTAHAKVYDILRRRFFSLFSTKLEQRLRGAATIEKPFDLFSLQREFTRLVKEIQSRGYTALAPVAA